MKKTVMKFAAMFTMISMLFALTACGSNPKKDEAIDAFNSGNTAFTETATLINENPDMVDEELIALCQQMSEQIAEYKGILEDEENEYTDETYDDIIKWMGDTKKWSEDTKKDVESVIADPTEFKKEQATKALQAATTAYNEVATYMNDHIDQIDDAIIEVSNQMATSLENSQKILEGDYDATVEQWDDLIKGLEDVETWSVNALEQIKTAIEG